MSLSMLNRAAVVAALASVVTAGSAAAPPATAADSVGEVRRDLKEETADRKAADVELEKELRGAIDSGKRETLARSKAHADDVAEKAKQDAKAHADKQADRAKKESKAYTDGETAKAKKDVKTYADVQTEKAKNDAKTHADEKADDAKKESKLYTDEQTEKAKKDVKTYADEKVDLAKVEVKQHADEKAAQAEQDANLHADVMADQVKAEAKTEADAKAQAAKVEAIADTQTKLTQTKSDIDVKLLQAKNEAKDESTSESKAYVDTVLVDTVNTVRADAINLADATLAAARAYTDSRLPAAPPAPRDMHVPALLTLDGEFAAWVDSLDVTLRAEVARHSPGPGRPIDKALASTPVSDVALRLDPFGGTSTMLAWINGLLTGAHPSREAELYILDAGGKVTSRLRLLDALPLEVEFPALDNSVASAGGCAVTIKLSSDGVQDRPVADPPPPQPRRKIKGCRADLEEIVVDNSGARPESGVRKISPFKIAATVNQIGFPRDYVDPFGPTEIPDLVFTIASARADGWRNWFTSSVLNGNPGQEATGKLVFRDDRGNDIGVVTLTGMGVFSTGFSAGTDGGKDDDLQVKVYVQTMELASSGN